MIPRLPWRARLRLAFAVWRGDVWIERIEWLKWGQRVTLRTTKNEPIIIEEEL